MGNVKEDLVKGICYPLGSLTLSTIIWRLFLSKLSSKMRLSDKNLLGIMTLVMYIFQWSICNPHAALVVPLSPSMDLYLFLAAGFYLRSITRKSAVGGTVYNVISVLSLLDMITYRKGGDIAVCYLFLTEFPDLVVCFLMRFVRSEALIAVTDAFCHLIFRVLLFGHLLIVVLLQKKLSEDLKMNLFIIHMFSYSNFPSILFETFWRMINKKMGEFRRPSASASPCGVYTLRVSRSRSPKYNRRR